MVGAVTFDKVRVDTIFASLDRSDLPGAAVGIAIAGTPVYRKGFGLANLELPCALAPTTRMRVGSITKHFAALAYLLLCEDGKAAIDDRVGTFLPELHPVARDVTMRQLMGHTGGLRDVFTIYWQFSGRERPTTSSELLAMYSQIDDVSFSPNTDWNYSNGGYLLVGSVVERITGQSLEDVLRERIFEPVGMRDTLLRRWDTDFVPNSASTHALNAAGAYQRMTLGVALGAEAGLVSTVDDLLMWLAHMAAPKVGTPASWLALTTPLVLDNGTSTGYGLGLIEGSYRGAKVIWHGGGVAGGNAEMVKVPAAKLDLAVMVNRDDVSARQFAEAVLDACLPDLEPVVPGARGPQANGVFRSPTTGRVIELTVKGGAQIGAIDAAEMSFEPAGERLLRPAGRYASKDVSITLAGDATWPDAIGYSHYGNHDTLAAVPRAAAQTADAIAGAYRSAATETSVTIEPAAGGAWLCSTGRFGSVRLALHPLADGIWRVVTPTPIDRGGGILSFDRERGGFSFSNANTRALPFRLAPA